MKKVLFICMGNICRSPSAEAVFKQLVKAKGAEGEFVIDSAGTHSYHIGSKPDQRSMRAALKRGIDMQHLRARQVVAGDFDRFDYLVTMDDANQQKLKQMFPSTSHHKVVAMMSFAKGSKYDEVPDPYYGEGDGFELVLDLLENSGEGLIEYILNN